MIILVTGASSGIGAAATRLLLADGHTVYAAARRMERMADLQAEGARLIRLDVTDDDSMTAAVQTILDNEGHIDALINNAGYGFFGALETVPLDEARRQFDVNVFGLARLSQLVIPIMRRQGHGRIVNVASMAGHFCEPRGDWYHATKYAVVALSDCMRMELKPFGIDVVLIEPGAIRSEWCDIAMDNMLATSHGTPYGSGAARHASLFRMAYRHFATPPERVGSAIHHAVTARRPRIRYRRGFGSTTAILLHDLLPTRWFDSIVTRLMGR